jgi:hypothetical protein
MQILTQIPPIAIPITVVSLEYVAGARDQLSRSEQALG